MIQKRYQVFVSSTYEDLREERQQVIQALLELDCIPSGMELFPAADEDQWTLIKNVIDECDYYIVVIGGRYGSIGKDGLSYTEKEYRYAVSKKKPVIAFLHKDPTSLPVNKTDQLDEKKKRLDGFRALTEKKVCKYWTSAAELGGLASRSITQAMNRKPGVGWVRANAIPDGDIVEQMEKLTKEKAELQNELKKATEQANELKTRYIKEEQVQGKTSANPPVIRHRMPPTRPSITHKFEVAGHEGFLNVGLYEDGTPGEMFITMAKEGSTVGGMMDSFAIAVTLCLQHGVTLEALVKRFSHQRFEPNGMTSNTDIPFAKSIVDYIFRWLGLTFLEEYRKANLPRRDGNQSPNIAEMFDRLGNKKEV